MDWEIKTLHVCPNGCEKCFDTTVHIMQSWKVDAAGEFVKVLEDCIQTTHGPDNDNIWSCMECGAEALQVQCRQVSIEIDGSDGTRRYSLFFPMQDDSVVYWRFVRPEFHKAVILKAGDGSEFIDAAGTILPVERPE